MKPNLEEKPLGLTAACRLSGLNPLELMVRARLLGVPAGQMIPMGTLLRIRSGAGRLEGEAAGPESGDSREALRRDPVPRRRLVRTLLDKLSRQGKWHPAVVTENGLLRGLGEHEKGMAREAVEQLRRRGWLIEQARRLHGSAIYSLNPDFRRQITQMASGGLCEDEVLHEWLSKR
jgi:hypothetical protein